MAIEIVNQDGLESLVESYFSELLDTQEQNFAIISAMNAQVEKHGGKEHCAFRLGEVLEERLGDTGQLASIKKMIMQAIQRSETAVICTSEGASR